MKAPFDLSKLRKEVNKTIPGMSVGFNDPETFLDLGCAALNYLCSSRFYGGIPLEGKSTMLGGSSGSGKSYIASGNLVKDAQSKGVFPIILDTENALDEEWLQNLGVDTSPENLLKLHVSTVDDVAKFLTTFIEGYKKQNEGVPYKERGKVLIVLDSLGMLITPIQQRQFEEGDMKGDFSKAKQITSLLRVAMAKIAVEPIGIVMTNHVYQSMDKYSADPIAGGNMVEFATSVIIQMEKLLMREDEEGNKLASGEVAGIRSSIVIRKSRYAKPFEKIQVFIPFSSGIDRMSGMFPLCEKLGLLIKEGNQYAYTSRETGEIHKAFRKQLKAKGIYDLIIKEHPLWEKERNDKVGVGVESTEEEGVD